MTLLCHMNDTINQIAEKSYKLLLFIEQMSIIKQC